MSPGRKREPLTVVVTAADEPMPEAVFNQWIDRWVKVVLELEALEIPPDAFDAKYNNADF